MKIKAIKVQTIKYFLKESFINLYRNKLMSLASISIVIAALVITGLFFLIINNLMTTADDVSSKPQLSISCETNLAESKINNIEKTIKRKINIVSIKKVSKKDNFEKAKKILKNDKSLLEGFDSKIMPVTFKVKLGIKLNKSTIQELRKIKGVVSIDYSQEVIDFYNNLSRWITISAILLLIVLFAFAAFIISNTIKLTIFTRRREISIMKYIGATDWFIRWPFILEGIIVGIAGGIISFFIVLWGYMVATDRIVKNEVMSKLIPIEPTGDIWNSILFVLVTTGIIVGALSSIYSLNRYLKV